MVIVNNGGCRGRREARRALSNALIPVGPGAQDDMTSDLERWPPVSDPEPDRLESFAGAESSTKETMMRCIAKPLDI